MQKSKDKSEEESANLEDFENHRQNIRDKKGIVTDITPEDESSVILNIELIHGDKVISEKFNTKEIEELMNQEGYNPEVTPVKELENEVLKMEYENSWEIKKEFQKLSDKNSNSNNARDVYYKSKRLILASLGINIIFFFSGIATMLSGSLLGLFLIAIGLCIQVLAGLHHQSSTRLYIYTSKNSIRSLAPVSRGAYHASEKGFIYRIFDALTFHMIHP